VVTAAAPVTTPNLRLINVDKRLRVGRETVAILHGVSFEVQPAELVALVGPSGSGKSTILGIAAGLDTATSGSVFLDGTDISHLPERELASLRARRVGMVFQSFNLLPTLTALENVELPLHVPGGIRRPSSSAEKLLSEVGLRHRLHHRPAQLSGGEQQRVAVARALITEPAIIVADEPTGNLDTSTGDELITLLLDLRKQRGTTLLVATHDNDLAVRADRILRVRDGRLTG
jgi:putative ABC transport system ATP-binding protein